MLQKLITISNMEKKQGKTADGRPWQMIKITDENNDKYSFFTTKKDNTDTMAFKFFKDNKLTFGSKVGITYSEEDKQFTNKEGKEIAYKQRGIAFFTSLDDPTFEVEQPPVDINEINTDSIPF